MQAEQFVEALQTDLAAIAAVGDDDVSAASRRLIAAVASSARLRLIDALTQAALELNPQLPSGHVEVRLAAEDPSLVYVDEPDVPAPAAGEVELVARITLRLPEGLKASVERAAAREGVSVNAWLVRTLARAVSGSPGRRGPGNRLTGFGRS